MIIYFHLFAPLKRIIKNYISCFSSLTSWHLLLLYAYLHWFRSQIMDQLTNWTSLWFVVSLHYVSETWTACSCFVTVLTTFLFFDIIGPDSTCQHPSVKTYSGSEASKIFSPIRTHAQSLPAVSLYTVAPVFLWEWALSSISSKPSDLCLHLEVERNVPTSISSVCLWLQMLFVIFQVFFFKQWW